MNCRAIIFDLDGTLVDTLEDLTCAINAALARFSLPAHTPEACRMMIGNGAQRFAERALPAEKRHLAGRVVELMREHYRHNYCQNSTLYEGTGEVVTMLSKRGIRMAVLTNKDHVIAGRIIEHFFARDTFEHVIGAMQGRPIKPDPGAALEIVESMGLGSGDFLFIGDSAVDIATARAAGIRPVGAAWGFRSRHELQRAGADIIIDTPREILDLVA